MRISTRVARAGAIAALTLIAGVLILFILLMLFEERLIFFPERGGVGSSPGGEVWLRTADGVAIHGWHIPHPGATQSLLYLHGNAGNLESRRGIFAQLARLELDILAIDYRGYGKSGGEPSEAGLYADTLAAHAWLLDRTEADRIFVYGESVGGGPASELAVTHPVAGLILQSSFTNIADMAALSFPGLPVRWLVRTKFDNLAKLPRVSAPKLIIHSRRDEIIPFSMAERLFAAAVAPKQKLWLDRSGHNELFALESAAVLEALRAFIDRDAR
jgi:fermentation-respiration switch protein FrsA (DUF1100 family)